MNSLITFVIGLTAAVCIDLAVGLTVSLSTGATVLLGVGSGMVCTLLAFVALDR